MTGSKAKKARRNVEERVVSAAELMTANEAAREMGIPVKTLYARVKARTVRAYYAPGSRWRLFFVRDEIVAKGGTG